MPSQTLFIESKHDKTPLQVYISYNPGTTTNKEEAPAIIIAHPYGPLGGNMNNNVVIAIQRHFLSCGYITACINFRGCGKSKGKTSWTGLPEREDYISVMDYLLKGEDYPKVNHLVLCVSW
jgi:alpha/beta superfamily hydrolase